MDEINTPRISHRTQNLGTEHAFVVLAEVNRLLAEGKDIISFSIGQPDFRTPQNICLAAKRAIDEGSTATQLLRAFPPCVRRLRPICSVPAG